MTHSKPSSSAAATRHQESLLQQLAGQERSKDLVDISTRLCDHFDPSGNQGEFQGPRNGPAYQGVDSQVPDALGPVQGIFLFHDNTVAGGFLTAIHVNQQQGARDIEYRRNPALPVWNSNSHSENKKRI